MATTEFKISQTAIPGLFEIDITLLEDERGYFQEKFQKEKLVALGFPKDFMPVQQNISYNRQVGVTRGFHAEPWEKYLEVISGSVYAVFLDLREGDNFGKKQAIVIDQNKAVFVPLGVANSFQTLEADTYYSYLVNAHWSSQKTSEYKFVNLGDPDLAVEWPISLAKAIISDKDRNHPMLKDIKPF
ncbi:MAG: dTDP-4-dehydrorhamnose 3,5-epimerase family protein [Candidatus Doudnabacteria bacterium]